MPEAGLRVCCGGVGTGATHRQRAGLMVQLASFDPPLESVPVNNLVRVEGSRFVALRRSTLVRTIAAARITMPKSYVRGQRELGEGIQALCFFAGANSIFYGDRLLTTNNPEAAEDRVLMARLGITAQT